MYTGIHQCRSDIIPSHVYAPNERFKRCVIDEKKCESQTVARKSKRQKMNKADKDGYLECGQVSDDDED